MLLTLIGQPRGQDHTVTCNYTLSAHSVKTRHPIASSAALPRCPVPIALPGHLCNKLLAFGADVQIQNLPTPGSIQGAGKQPSLWDHKEGLTPALDKDQLLPL